MYAAIRTYKTAPGASEEIARRAQEGYAPIVQGIPGFVAYYGIIGENDTVVTVSVFQDQAGEEESTRRAASWVQEALAGLMQGAPQVIAGRVAWQAGAQGGRD